MSGYITFEERLEIESMIFQRCSFGEIAKKINKDRSTISREIRRHSIIEKSGYSGFGFNACVHKETCKMGMVCGDKCVKTSCKLCVSDYKLAFQLQKSHFVLQMRLLGLQFSEI
jgi:IS30 family transposase